MSIDFIYNSVKKEYCIDKFTWNPLVIAYKREEYINPSFVATPITFQFRLDKRANKRAT